MSHPSSIPFWQRRRGEGADGGLTKSLDKRIIAHTKEALRDVASGTAVTTQCHLAFWLQKSNEHTVAWIHRTPGVGFCFLEGVIFFIEETTCWKEPLTDTFDPPPAVGLLL